MHADIWYYSVSLLVLDKAEIVFGTSIARTTRDAISRYRSQLPLSKGQLAHPIVTLQPGNKKFIPSAQAEHSN